MPRREPFGDVLASMTFLLERPDRERIPVELRLGMPYPEDRCWMCPCELAGLEARYSDVGGDNALQALCLALSFLRRRLEDAREDGARILEPTTGEDWGHEALNAVFGTLGRAWAPYAFEALVAEALEEAKDDPAQAVTSLDKLADAMADSARHSASVWHEEQALGFAFGVARQSGDLDRAATFLDRQIEQLTGRARYAEHALASAHAERALLLFDQGRPDEAALAVEEALRWAGRAPSPSPVLFLEQALARLREYRERNS